MRGTEDCDHRRESWEWGGRNDAGKKGVAITEQPDEDQEEDGGRVDPRHEETIGNVFVSV